MPKRICSHCFSLIQVPARMKIIQQLKRGPKMATKFVDILSLSQPTVSYHLRLLEKNGILLSKKSGRKIFYFLNRKYPCKGCLIFKLPLNA